MAYFSTAAYIWANGATLNLYSAEEPSRLRGPNFDAIWCDELAVWPNAAEVWDMAQLALRVPGPQGHAPCAVVTTTPRAIPLP